MATTASANKTIQKATPPDRLLKLWGEMLRTQKLHNGQTDTYYPSRILAEGNLVTATTHPVPPPPFFRSRSRQLGSESRPGGGGQRSSKSMRMGRYSSWNLPARGLTHPGGIALPKRPLPHPYDTQIRTLVAFPPAHYPIVCLCLPVAARPAALCPRAHTGGDPVTNSPRPPSTAFDKW